MFPVILADTLPNGDLIEQPGALALVLTPALVARLQHVLALRASGAHAAAEPFAAELGNAEVSGFPVPSADLLGRAGVWDVTGLDDERVRAVLLDTDALLRGAAQDAGDDYDWGEPAVELGSVRLQADGAHLHLVAALRHDEYHTRVTSWAVALSALSAALAGVGGAARLTLPAAAVPAPSGEAAHAL